MRLFCSRDNGGSGGGGADGEGFCQGQGGHGGGVALEGDAYQAAGVRGNVLDIITTQGLEADVLYACGPTPMLRAIKAYAAEHGIEAWISLEERMACGIGACLGCVCATVEVDGHSNVKNRRICKDGPVFDAQEVDLG